MVAKREETKFFELFVLSGVAAGVSKTAAAPLERVKLLVQSQDEMIKQVFNMQELQIPTLETAAQKICLLLAKTYVLYRVFFFTGPPPKKLKYGKLRLGEVRCI